ncbi:unnamed protein product [Absidia cylindrospora]
MSNVRLLSSDNEEFVVQKEVAERSILIKNMLEGVEEGKSSGPFYDNVIEWCDHHSTDPVTTDETERRTTDIDEWDQKFMEVDQETLFDIILAANYLDIKPLLDVGCKTVANMIKGKSAEEIRKIFNIVNDFTPEEEAQIRKENEWAEDR